MFISVHGIYVVEFITACFYDGPPAAASGPPAAASFSACH